MLLSGPAPPGSRPIWIRCLPSRTGGAMPQLGDLKPNSYRFLTKMRVHTIKMSRSTETYEDVTSQKTSINWSWIFMGVPQGICGEGSPPQQAKGLTGGDVAVHEGLKGWRIWNRIFFDSQNRKSRDTLEKYGQLQEFGV